MNTQDRAAIEQMLEMLADNREYIEANERDTYLAMYDKAIADGEILLRKPEDTITPELLGHAQELLDALDRSLPHSQRHHAAGERFNLRITIDKAKGKIGPTVPPAKPSDYAWPTIQHYEHVVGYEVSDTFKSGWAMARTTHDMFGQMMGGEE